MMFLPFPPNAPALDWDWEWINYEVFCNQMHNSPPGPLETFVNYCVGWYRNEEVQNNGAS